MWDFLDFGTSVLCRSTACKLLITFRLEALAWDLFKSGGGDPPKGMRYCEYDSVARKEVFMRMGTRIIGSLAAP